MQCHGIIISLWLLWCYTYRYAYQGRDDTPAGVSGSDDIVEWEVELVGFDKEGHWQVGEAE